MAKKGKITTWNDEKGYGFITPTSEGKRVFLHIRTLAHQDRRPTIGDNVSYSVSTDNKGRLNASNVSFVDNKNEKKVITNTLETPVVIAVLFLASLAVGNALSLLPDSLFIIYAINSFITFIAYARDKKAAETGSWRISENHLHVLSILGGWPGALIAQSVFRHKTIKQSFRTRFLITIIINIGFLIWMLTAEGSKLWLTIVNSLST